EKHGDLFCQQPVLGGEAKAIPVREIEQIYCTHRLQRESSSFQTNRRHSQLNVYNINALQQDGTSSVVISGITSKTDAILIERQIETFLNIPPERVPGEIDDM
ncbi:MAG: hypothetical protein KDD60_10085, partial [Bdellovibrionales bacterium]|nr:hypothetical protein [Bdellovibrionales bacterium]